MLCLIYTCLCWCRSDLIDEHLSGRCSLMTAEEVVSRLKDRMIQHNTEIRNTFLSYDKKRRGKVSKRVFREVCQQHSFFFLFCSNISMRIYIYIYIYTQWQNRSLIILDSCPHWPYVLVMNLHLYSLCFKILLKPNPVYYRYRIDFLPQKLNFFLK